MKEQKEIYYEESVYSVSADMAVEQVYKEVIEKGRLSTLFDRWQIQQPQCGIGKAGVCCHVCGLGPCRITPKASAGICGATADTIVARNMLRHVTAGTAAYIHQARQAAVTLKAVAEGKTSFSIKDAEKLKSVSAKVGINGDQTTNELALAFANLFQAELAAPSDSPSRFVKAFAPPGRLKVWEKLGVIPGGPMSEITDAMTRTMSHINTDPFDLLTNAMRLSISAAYMGLMGAVTIQDIILGTPKVISVDSNLGILDPDTVNILVHGHQPFLAEKIVELSHSPSLMEKAKEAGASGIKVYGSADTGLELIGRNHHLAGQIGSWMKQEFAVATGVVDLVALDFNCTIPGIKTMAENYHTELVSTEKLLRVEGAHKMSFQPEKAEDDAREIITMAVGAYKERDKDKIFIPKEKTRSTVGFTTEAVLDVLGGSLKPLIDAITSGKIKGIAAVVGCTSLYKGKHNFDALILTEELVARDILVINTGCCASDVQHSKLMTAEGFEYAGDGLKDVCISLGIPPALSFGSCTEIHRVVEMVTALAATLNVDTSDLPVAVSAPEWLDEKALADGFFSVAFGLFTHIAPALPITGSKRISTFLSHRESKRKLLRPESPTIFDITEGEIGYESDPVKAAALIEYHLAKRLQKLMRAVSS